MIAWIYKAIKRLKESFELVKWVFLIVALVSSMGWLNTCSSKNNKISNLVDILQNKTEQVKTLSGNLAQKSEVWQIEKQELNKEISQKEATNSVYLNELSQAKKTIKDLNIKLKRAEKYIKTSIESRDSITTEIIFTDCQELEIKPIEKKHIKINFVQRGNELDVTYLYQADVTTVVYLEKDPEQFFLWRWIFPKWEHYSITSIDDPNATITNHVNIEFQ